jgi:hypothetical protein
MGRRIQIPSERDVIDGWGALNQIYVDVHRERIRAHIKHDDNGESMERRIWDDPAWLSTVVEEVGEVARVLCEQRHGTYRDTFAATTDLREELVQVAAMVTAWIDAIDLDEDH